MFSLWGGGDRGLKGREVRYTSILLWNLFTNGPYFKEREREKNGLFS